MFKLLRHAKKYIVPTILSPVLMVGEVVLELLIPLVMADIVNLVQGEMTEDSMSVILRLGLKMLLYAINNGIDLVIELPTLYAISSAENFASGAIKILNSLNIVDFISFGSESKDITLLNDIADVLAFEPAQYKTLLSHELARGESYPKARENAVENNVDNVELWKIEIVKNERKNRITRIIKIQYLFLFIQTSYINLIRTTKIPPQI